MFFFLMISLVHCSFSQDEFIKRGKSDIRCDDVRAYFRCNILILHKVAY
jgi:hypothetical protein